MSAMLDPMPTYTLAAQIRIGLPAEHNLHYTGRVNWCFTVAKVTVAHSLLGCHIVQDVSMPHVHSCDPSQRLRPAGICHVLFACVLCPFACFVVNGGRRPGNVPSPVPGAESLLAPSAQPQTKTWDHWCCAFETHAKKMHKATDVWRQLGADAQREGDARAPALVFPLP